MEQVFNAIDWVSGILWGPGTPLALLAAGLLFTVWTRFSQYTAMTHGVQVVRGVYDDPDDPGAINHFQALSAALSATVGLGNIGGVALAIGAGGPGALVWMWLTGVFGMALKTVEITLAMMYRNTDDPDNPHGGAMWVVEKVIGSKGGIWQPIARIIGVFFCITLLISCFTGGNMFQAWSVADLSQNFFGFPKLLTGSLMAIIVGLVIIGGIKRIGHVAGKLVPFMCVLYVLAALGVLATHIPEIPGMFALIFKSAFSSSEAGGAFLGGTMGYAFMQGMKRALFSNEAGQGPAPIAHAAAKTDEPAREGIVGGIGPFVDTLCICTITALVIIATGTWNREGVDVLRGPITLAPAPAASDAADPTLPDSGDGALRNWTVQASTELELLPEKKLPWKEGDEFFLVAQVSGARTCLTHVDWFFSLFSSKEPGVDRTRVTGKVINLEEGDKPERLAIEWAALELAPSGWEGTPTGAALVSPPVVYRSLDGASLTAHAFNTAKDGLGKYLVTIAAWLFAISTMISWSYYGEQGIVYMVGNAGVLPYKLVFLGGAIFAAVGINDTSTMMSIMDLGTGAMLWSNIPIVLALGFLAVRSNNDYLRRLKAGEFKPHKAPPITDVVDGSDVEKK